MIFHIKSYPARLPYIVNLSFLNVQSLKKDYDLQSVFLFDLLMSMKRYLMELRKVLLLKNIMIHRWSILLTLLATLVPRHIIMLPTVVRDVLQILARKYVPREQLRLFTENQLLTKTNA